MSHAGDQVNMDQSNVLDTSPIDDTLSFKTRRIEDRLDQVIEAFDTLLADKRVVGLNYDVAYSTRRRLRIIKNNYAHMALTYEYEGR